MRAANRRAPQFDRTIGAARSLQYAAEIDIGRHEIGILGDGVVERFDRGGLISGLTVQAGAIEICHVKLWVFPIEIDPDLVELPSKRGFAWCRQAGGRVDEFANREISRRGLL